MVSCATWSERGEPASASVVILAGGRGERLGRDKAGVTLGGQTLLQRALGLFAPFSDDLIVVARADQRLEAWGARVVHDEVPDGGVLAGMAAGLGAAQHAWCIVVACDMPFVNLRLFGYMLSLATGYDVVVPKLDVGLEPLHALYHMRCLPALRQALAEGRRRVVSFYESLHVRYILPSESAPFDPLGRSFYNINTPEELARAQGWLDEASRTQL
jgi:molybdenum cofactor guanylyltransferase